jgi:hypothetical protein
MAFAAFLLLGLLDLLLDRFPLREQFLECRHVHTPE